MNLCLYWNQISSSWNQGNWTWSECELVQDVCAVWGTTGEWWSNAEWNWSDCHSSQDVCKVWGTTEESWANANWNWSDCSSSITPMPPVPVQTIEPAGVDATVLIQPWLIEPWNPYRANDEIDKKRKKLIKLICRIKGETYEQEKEAGTKDIDVDDVKMIVKKVMNIDLDVKLEE